MLKLIKRLFVSPFSLFCLTGAAVIFLNNRIEQAWAIFLPAVLLGIYGLVAGDAISRCSDERSEDRIMDSIYFMSFLYTFMSLATLIFKMKVLGGVVPETLLSAVVLSYLAISFTTSIGGILVHAFVGRYFRKRKSEETEDRAGEKDRIKESLLPVLSERERAYRAVKNRYFRMKIINEGGKESFQRNRGQVIRKIGLALLSESDGGRL